MHRIVVAVLSLIACGIATAAAERSAPGQSSQTQTSLQSAQVTVTGEVRTPGPLVTDKPLTLLAALAQAGDFTADAAVVEIHRRSSGVGPVTATTPANEYQTQYVVRADLVSGAASDPSLVSGDFIVVRRALEIHPPTPPGQFGEGAFRLDQTTWGVTAPSIRTMTEPQYTRAGMALKMQGTVDLEAVVKADGTVGDVRVIRGLDAQLPQLLAELKALGGPHEQAVLQIVGNGPIGLDANAIECVKRWAFVPGTILGKPTPVIQPVWVRFKLR